MESLLAEPPRSPGKSLSVDSTLLLHDPVALRERAREDGYLFFKQFLPKYLLDALRADMLAIVEKNGWRKTGEDFRSNRIDLEALNRVPDAEMRADIGVTEAAYCDVQKLERFHSLPHYPKLVELYRTLFGRDVLVHPRHIARMITGHRVMSPTPPHQDFPHIQGTSETWTCWFPLADCPRSTGGLTVMRGSNAEGVLPIQPAKGAGGIAVRLCPWETQWVEGDFEAGDILTFNSYTLHKALRCADKETIRLSLDVRYQPIDQPVEVRSLSPHVGLTWDEIYQDWKSKDLQYYWRNRELEMGPWNDNLHKPSRRIC